jgi:hypothetical protein
MNLNHTAIVSFIVLGLAACQSKPKPVSNNITKTTVTVSGEKDSVINNKQKNYGNATVSEPCVKCLIGMIQQTKNYKTLTASAESQNIMYDVNWITSSRPIDVGGGSKIINGMAIDVNSKDDGAAKKLTTYLYNNQNAQVYLLNKRNKYVIDSKIDSASVKKIRNACFWGVASAK